MEFFKPNTRIRFMQQRMAAAIFSAIIFLASIIAISVNGLNLGLDFTSGTQVDVVFVEPTSVNQVRDQLKQAGFDQAVVQQYSSREMSVRVGEHKDLKQEALTKRLKEALPNGKIGSLQYIGPSVSSTLITNGILAVLVSLILTMVYITFRFEYRFALAAAVALIHDPILILGIFSAFHLEFNMLVLTALLTVIGYSLNDTIVVYDRIRENFRKLRKNEPIDVVDISINQTLSRTIMTSGLTLLVVFALYVYGGAVIQGFALALIIGIVIGTYSSIYVAGSLALAFGMNRQTLVPPPKRAVDDLP